MINPSFQLITRDRFYLPHIINMYSLTGGKTWFESFIIVTHMVSYLRLDNAFHLFIITVAMLVY